MAGSVGMPGCGVSADRGRAGGPSARSGRPSAAAEWCRPASAGCPGAGRAAARGPGRDFGDRAGDGADDLLDDEDLADAGPATAGAFGDVAAHQAGDFQYGVAQADDDEQVEYAARVVR